MVPYLSEGDEISLSPEFILKQSLLIDSTLGARHAISLRAYLALVCLQKPLTYKKWLKTCALNQAEAIELINFLNHTGAMKVRRRTSIKIRLSLSRIAWLIQGVKAPALTHRDIGNFWGVILSVARATSFIWISWPVIIVLVFGSGAFNTPRFCALSGFVLVSIISSLIIHEYTHVYFAELAGKPSAVIQQGLRLGVLHPKMARRHEAASAIIGPLAGGAVALALGVGVRIFLGNEAITYSVLIASLHMASWLPWYGDGLTLWRIGRSKWA